MRMGMAMKMILSAMVLSVAVAVGETEYTYGEDLVKQDGVPAGKVTKHVWKGSDLFEGTAREYYVYVPAQYDGSEAAALMVFQDGHTCVKEGGDFRVPAAGLETGRRLRLRVRARDVSLALKKPEDVSVLNIFEGTVTSVSNSDRPQTDVSIDVGGAIIWSQITRKSLSELEIAPGKKVFAMVKAVALDHPVAHP